MSIERRWQDWNAISILLLPLAGLFWLVAASRRLCYRLQLCRRHRLPVPVIVVGNITVGGTGKTPLVIWLVNYLKAAGWHPGVVARGYGGKASRWPQQVRADSDPVMVGDEPLLVAAGTGCPVCVGPDRVAAAQQLLQHGQCDIIVSDDGLQHYRLARDVEIVVVDGQRRYGNGLPLPAGPLREPVKRAQRADWVIVQGEPLNGEHRLQLSDAQIRPLRGGAAEPLANWAGRSVHAVAGIGFPQRFFQTLADAGLQVSEHPYPDHHPFAAADLAFDDQRPVLMTAKDAVKCRRFARDHHYVVTVQARPGAAFEAALAQKLKEFPRG